MASKDTTARRGPRSATASPASNLPTELIAHLLKLAVEEIEETQAFEAQWLRVKRGKVCRQWCTVALPLPVYLVGSSYRAGKLARALKTLDPAHRPLALDITREEEGTGREKKLAQLLSLCAGAETLRLDISRELVQTCRMGHSNMGSAVEAALEKMFKLQTVELCGEIRASPQAWSRLFRAWPQLAFFRAPSMFYRGVPPSNADENDFHGMPTLREFAVGDMCGSEFVKGVLVQSKSRLEVLRIGRMFSRDHSEIAPALSNVADSLVELEISELESPSSRIGVFADAIKELSKIETLSLGGHLVEFDTLFSEVLPSLYTLRSLTITCGFTISSYSRAPFPSSVVDYVSNLKSPGQLKSLSISKLLLQGWHTDYFKAVVDATGKAGVIWDSVTGSHRRLKV